MSFLTAITFYTAREAPDPKEWILRICQITGAKEARWVDFLEEGERWLSESDDYWIFLAIERGETGWIRNPHDLIEVVPYSPPLGENVPIEKVPEFYEEGKCLHIAISAINCPLCKKISEAVQKSVPSEIRDYCAPGLNGVSISIGYHDLWGDTPTGPVYFGQVFCSINIISVGIPVPGKAEIFEEMIFNLPEVKEVKSQFEEITGPLEQCVFLSF